MRHCLFVALALTLVGCGPSGEELLKMAEQDIKDGNIDDAVEKVRKSADKKCPKGMLALGELYLSGTKIEPDHEAGFSLIREAAELKDPDGMFALSRCYKAGLGTKRDLHKAEYWEREAVDAGSQSAIVSIAHESYQEARGEWMKRRMDSENRYTPTHMEKVHAEKALSLFRMITDENALKEIWYMQGDMYYCGIGCDPSPSKAELWYKKSADAGDERAIRALGLAYCSGELIRQNYDEGVPLLKRVVDRKDYSCCRAIGRAYLNPRWKGFDLKTGIGYLEDVIAQAKDEHGFSSWSMYVEEELYLLGRIYVYEDETGVNFDKGIEYLKLAAEHYHPEAGYYLAVLYFNGDGVKRDVDKAMDYARTGTKSKIPRIKDAAERLYEASKKLYLSDY